MIDCVFLSDVPRCCVCSFQGKIACANVLSDMYALGVPDVDNMLMILAMSIDMQPSDREIVTRKFIEGMDLGLFLLSCSLFTQTPRTSRF